MISSMTGYGRGEATQKGITAIAEVRCVNSRFLEVTPRLPRTVTLHESDVKDLVRTKFSRGKVNVAVTIEYKNTDEIPLKINPSAAKSYYKLLESLRKAVNIKEKVTLDHLLKFSEVLQADELEEGDEHQWEVVKKAISKALDETVVMRQQEGGELMKDLTKRIKSFDHLLSKIEHAAKERIPEERARLLERIADLVADKTTIDEKRLELEIALLADRLDVTEECVRFRSHNKFFLAALKNEEAAGRKLNFLIQEMNREANTIGSKSNSTEIAHMVVAIKEDLEKIREQLQNIE
jgi:uncharacterized protein (TIGR00255 family)